jgi:hypothetical protein
VFITFLRESITMSLSKKSQAMWRYHNQPPTKGDLLVILGIFIVFGLFMASVFGYFDGTTMMWLIGISIAMLIYLGNKK